MEEMSVKEMREVNGGFWIIGGDSFVVKIARCNIYTKWGTNGKNCICGYHPF